MTEEMEGLILDLIKTHGVLTLATLREDGYPQANTVTYANDGLVLYFPTGRDSRKIQNIRHCDKVSLTIDHDYQDWSKIKGLSMAAKAEVLIDPVQIKRAMGLLLKKFPQMASVAETVKPEEVVVVKLSPRVISVINYEREFGHTDLVELPSP